MGARILLGVFVAAGAVAIIYLLLFVLLRMPDELPDGSFLPLFLGVVGAAITAFVTSIMISRHTIAAWACGILLPPIVGQGLFLFLVVAFA